MAGKLKEFKESTIKDAIEYTLSGHADLDELSRLMVLEGKVDLDMLARMVRQYRPPDASPPKPALHPATVERPIELKKPVYSWFGLKRVG